jgi:hypothetical protein
MCANKDNTKALYLTKQFALVQVQECKLRGIIWNLETDNGVKEQRD